MYLAGFRRTGCWPPQPDIMDKFQDRGVFKYEDLMQEDIAKAGEYGAACLEVRKSKSQEAYEDKYGTAEEEVAMPVKRKFDPEDESPEALLARVDAYVCLLGFS